MSKRAIKASQMLEQLVQDGVRDGMQNAVLEEPHFEISDALLL